MDIEMTDHSSPENANEVTDEMLVAAMRAFELMSSVLRYREKDKWHTCDMVGMRNAIRAALAVAPQARIRAQQMPTQKMDSPDDKAPIGGTESCTCHFFGVGTHHVPGCPFYKIITSRTACDPAIQPQTSPEHQSAPAYAAAHNSGEGDPSVMPDYVGADTFDIETEQREGWAYDPL